MDKIQKDFSSFLKSFKDHVGKLGFKNSIQKDYILKTLYFSNAHLSAEQIVHHVKNEFRIDIGIATVYRTIKFFESINMVESLDIGDGTKRYELNLSLHHDHMVCTSCHKIIEFSDTLIEEQQIKVAQHHNFELREHVMTLYGTCESCTL